MKIIVTHNSPDWDAITSVWLLKRYLPGWNEAQAQFVPAGERLASSKQKPKLDVVIEKINQDEVIHVDTGLGPLDHHQTQDDTVSAASVTWDFVQTQNDVLKTPNSDKTKDHIEAISRIVKVVVAIDHFKEVFWDNPSADYHEFSLLGVLEGLKLQKPNQDEYYVEFGMQCLDAMLHNFENRIWAEKEIAHNGVVFNTRWGESMGFETINDTVLKLAQKMGYILVVRKDPRKGYVRIKARPTLGKNIVIRHSGKSEFIEDASRISSGDKRSWASQDDKGKNIDLTLAYENLSKIDPDATWFLHVSKKMLLNGTPKNPKMKPTKLTLKEIIKVLEKI